MKSNLKKAIEKIWHLKRNTKEETIYIKDTVGNKYQLTIALLNKHTPLRKGYVWNLDAGIKVIKQVNNEEIAWFGWTRVEHWSDGKRLKYFQEIVDNLELCNYYESR